MSGRGWKLIYFYEDERIELYNLDTDLGERNDLSQIESEKANYLQNKLKNWLASTDARLPMKKNIN
ncbi:hypothetical protein [Belliella baltica]|uniref:hypothetical protein n=1 Tax=Belliella baltica TaxID=232259 RepID=UPI0005A05A3F|nr:hypothetical protein [Belliella baltica]